MTLKKIELHKNDRHRKGHEKKRMKESWQGKAIDSRLNVGRYRAISFSSRFRALEPTSTRRPYPGQTIYQTVKFNVDSSKMTKLVQRNGSRMIIPHGDELFRKKMAQRMPYFNIIKDRGV